jgi:Zn-dependent protease with chaperone function
VRILLRVLLFLIWESQSPETARWVRMDPSVGIPLFFSGYLLLILIVHAWGKRLAQGIINDGELGPAVDRFNFAMSIVRMLNPAWFAFGVFVLGWNSHLLEPITLWPVETPGTIIGVLPALLAWMGLWWSQFPLDRALREHNVLSQLEADLPVFSSTNFRDYFINKLRVDLLFAIVPLLLILVIRDIAAVVIYCLSHAAVGQRLGISWPVSDLTETVLSVISVACVLLFSPKLLTYVLHTQRLPDSPLRRGLSAISQRAGVRCREILLWRTQNNLGNAAVMGLIPQLRYVMLSDLLLESMTDLQIQAVFAHELGHVKHRHLAWFVVFFPAVIFCLFTLSALLEDHLRLNQTVHEIFDLGSMIISGVILLISFGFLSRWFERQADVYAARTLERESLSQPLPPQTTGASIFASALERVAIVNNIPISARNWTHGSIQSRMRYIKRLGRDPQVAERFDRTGRRVFAGLVLLTIVCAAVAVYGGLHS